MGREVRRVAMDFDFPLEESFAEYCRERHKERCKRESHEECRFDWEDEIPQGEGWQLWQTVSDGPVTPVFATADELIDYMCQPVPREQQVPYDPGPYPKRPSGQGWRREIAETFVREVGWAPSSANFGDVMMPGAEAFARDVLSKKGHA